MNHYRAGRRLEYLAREELRADGYTVVRSAGSKTPIDLVAMNADHARVIQVKKSAADVNAAIASLAALALPAHVRREVWSRENGVWRIVNVLAGTSLDVPSTAL